MLMLLLILALSLLLIFAAGVNVLSLRDQLKRAQQGSAFLTPVVLGPPLEARYLIPAGLLHVYCLGLEYIPTSATMDEEELL